MPSAKKSTAERLAAIRRHPLRRQILQAAEEAHAAGRLVSPVGLHRQLKAPMGSTSYHVKVLAEEGALKLLDEVPKRGASEHLYGIDEGILADISDAVALDQIAELIDDWDNRPKSLEDMGQLYKIVKSTGRPVEA